MSASLSQAVRCRACGGPLAPGAQFCGSCGAACAGPAGAGANESLIERKFVTVMFVDMVGSLNLIRDKDPEDAHDLLAAGRQLMHDAVHAYGGVVSATQGDGIMAMFGAPLAQEDHAERACLSALRLHALAALGHEGLSLRVGLNSGEVAVGASPNDFSSDFIAAGAVVHIASRLQAVAAPTETVVAPQTAALVRDVMELELVGERALKGLPQPLLLHRLVGAVTPARGPGSFARVAFLGRAEPLALLDRAMAQAHAGAGCVVGLCGEAGIGKSSLIDRFERSRGADVAMLRCVATYHTAVSALHPFAELVRKLLELDGGPKTGARAVVAARLAALGLDPWQYEPPLLDLLEEAAPQADWLRLDPQRRRERIGSAVIELLLAQAERRSLVIVLEDLQRTDSATVDLVERLIHLRSRHRLLAIVAFRPEMGHGWAGAPGYRELLLDRLPSEAMRSLIRQVAGTEVPARVRRKLVEWSQGNPLFLLEGVRALTEANALHDADAVALIAPPPSIGAVVAARIDRLPVEAKQVLLAASILGKDVSAELLAQTALLGPAALEIQLQVLTGAGFLRPLEPGGGVYGFQHGLFQEVAYSTLLKRRRRDLHRAAFAALQQRRTDGHHARVEELAFHAYGGGLWAQAAQLCAEAGRRAAARYSNREATLHLENAISALDRADPGAERLHDAIALRLDLRAACVPLLRLDRIGVLLAEAAALAGRLRDPVPQARIKAFLAGHTYLTRSAAGCLELCRGAMRLARRTGDAVLRIAPTIYAAQALYGLGEYRRSIAVLERERPLLDADHTGREVGLPLRPLQMKAYWLAIARAELGLFEPAQALTARMRELVDERRPFESVYALTAEGFVGLLRGRLEPALAASTSALGIADQHDIAFIIPVLASQVGYLLAAQGHVQEGLALAQRAMRQAEQIGSVAGTSRWSARLAEVCLRAGLLDEAGRHAEAARELAERGGERGYLCSALRLCAKVRLVQGDAAAALAPLARASALAQQLRLGPALAKCRFDAALLACRAGRAADARRPLRLAAVAFSRYGMELALQRCAELSAAIAGGDAHADALELFGSAE